MYSKTIIVGRVGREPEMRYIADGTPVTDISVAVDSGYGEKKKTAWYRVTCWRKLAETVNEYCIKGQLVLVEGELQEPKPYESKDGTWRASLDLRADRVQFLSAGKGKGDKSEAPAEGAEVPEIESESDLPF